DHHDPGADLDPLVEVNDILVAHADAAGRYRLTDRPWLVRTVDAVEARTEIHCARAEGIFGAAFHVTGQVGPALEHFGRRRPIRPFALAAGMVDARPGEAGAARAHNVPERRPVFPHPERPPLL